MEPQLNGPIRSNLFVPYHLGRGRAARSDSPLNFRQLRRPSYNIQRATKNGLPLTILKPRHTHADSVAFFDHSAHVRLSPLRRPSCRPGPAGSRCMPLTQRLPQPQHTKQRGTLGPRPRGPRSVCHELPQQAAGATRAVCLPVYRDSVGRQHVVLRKRVPD